MWSIITSGVVSIVKGWFDVKKSKQKAEAEYNLRIAANESDWDLKAIEAAKYSWKDELITVVWFAPLIVAWFDYERAMAWIEFVAELPIWYQFGMFGIMAASFGLRWYFKQQNFKIGK